MREKLQPYMICPHPSGLVDQLFDRLRIHFIYETNIINMIRAGMIRNFKDKLGEKIIVYYLERLEFSSVQYLIFLD